MCVPFVVRTISVFPDSNTFARGEEERSGTHRLLVPKPLLIFLVHCGKIVHGGQKDPDFDHVVNRGAGFFEDL